MNRRRAQNQNFDSLLDTMANVVGILVVVMAFTQIHVGEAVRRIHRAEELQLADSSAQARSEAMREVHRLESDLERFASPRQYEGIDLERRGLELSRLAAFRSNPSKPPMPAQKVVVALLREESNAEELERSLDYLRAEEQQMQIRLGDVEREFGNAVHRIRLPDPRPAPLGTDEMTFFCRYGRVKHIELDALNRLRTTGLEAAATATRRSGGSAISGLVRHFYKRDIGNEFFRWRLREVANNQVYVKLEFRHREVGEERNTIPAVESRFRRSLYAADPNQHFLLFHVWSDSFSVYLRARSIAEEMGYSVGWKMIDMDDEFGGYLGWGAHPTDPTPID